MMKFKRWKKMIVMLIVATMFLQSVVVYADDVPDNPKTESVQEATEEESTTLDEDDLDMEEDDADDQDDLDVDDDVDDSDDLDVEDDVDDPDADDDVDDQDVPNEKDSDEDSNKVTDSVDDNADGDGADGETDPVKEEVKAFLDAVADANLPTSIETTEEYDTVQEKVSELLGRYDALSDKAKEDDGVKGAKSKLDELKEQSRPDMPAEVKAFLDAVANIPEITPENAAEVAEYVYGPVSDAYDALLGTEYMERADVQEAEALYGAAIQAVDAALEMASGTFEAQMIQGSFDDVTGSTIAIRPNRVPADYTGTVDYQYRGFNIYGYPTDNIYWGSSRLDRIGASAGSNFAGSVEKMVGESGFFQRCPHNTFVGSECGHIIGQAFAPMGYCDIKVNLSEADIVDNIDYGIGYFDRSMASAAGVSNLAGAECLKVTYDANRPGRTTFTQTYYVNFLTSILGGYCPSCYEITSNQTNFSWHQYSDSFNVNVYAYYTVKFLPGGDSVTNMPSNVSNSKQYTDSYTVTTQQPQRDGYTFTGWVDDKGNNIGTTAVAKWYEGDGAYVTRTLTATWKENDPKPQKPTEQEAENILKGKYTVKVKCTNGSRPHTLAEKDYSIIATDITSISEVTKNDTSGKWEVEVRSTNQNFVDKFEKESNVDCDHNDVSGGFGVKLVWNGSAWTYEGTNTHTVATECNPTKNISYTVVYKAYENEADEVSNLPASETKQGTAPGSVDFTVSSQIPSRDGYEFAGWKVQGTIKKGGDTLTVTGDASATSVTEELYATWVKKPDAPVIDGQNGKLRVQVVCDATESDHKGKKENLRLRKPEDNDEIIEYTGGEVVRTDKSGYNWKYTITLYKSDFADRFGHNSGKNHEYVKDTKDTVNVTFYYKDGEWDYANLKDHNSDVEIVYEKNGSENYYCNYVVYHVEPKTTTKTPKIKVTKNNDGKEGFTVDPESGNAIVNYTVTIENISGFDIYGLRLTDTLTPTLTKKGNGEGTPEVTYTFSNWKVGNESITPQSGSPKDRVHVLQLIDRNTKFAKDQTVTLTYTVEIKNTGKVDADVHLENEAMGAAWSKAPNGQKSSVAKKAFAAIFRASIMSALDDDDDPPDVSGSDSSSASTETDAPDVTDSDTSEAGGSTGGSSTGGTLPAQYTLTYTWDLPDGAKPAKTLPADTQESRPAGSHFTVDTVNKAGDEVTADGKTYIFSGWKVPTDIGKETADGQYKGQYVMPKRDVTIIGEWHSHVWTPETDPEGHIVWVNGKAPDCIHNGTAKYVCSCGATMESEVADSALGHDFEHADAVDNCSTHSDENCTGHTFTCTRCNGSLKDGTKTEDHKYGDWIVDTAATMDTEGTRHHVCDDCGHTEYGTIPTLDKVTITIKYVNEEGNEVGEPKEVVVPKDSQYDVTEDADKIPEGYERNGDRTGDPVSGVADTNKTITVPVKAITYTVTYTDGVNGTAFANQEKPGLKKGDPTPAFDGTPSRSGYTFEGWTPAVEDTVKGNATYTAQWTLISENPTTPTTPPGGGGGGGNDDDDDDDDPTPTPPTPGTTPIIPGIVPTVGPTPTVVPTVTPVAATPAAPTPTAALVSPTPEAVELADEAVPLAAEEEKEQPEPEELDEEETPLAGGKGAAWALINFALMNLAIFESVMLLIGYFVKTKDDEEEEKRKLKKKGIFRIISLPIAVISLIVFILTEDITLPTGFVDKYTIVMLIIAIVQTVMVALSKKKYEDEDEA